MRTQRSTLNPLNYYRIKVKGFESQIVKIENSKIRTVPIYADIANDPPEESVEGQIAISDADEKLWWFSNGEWHTCGRQWDIIDDSAYTVLSAPDPYYAGYAPEAFLHDTLGKEWAAYVVNPGGAGAFHEIADWDGVTIDYHGPYGNHGLGQVKYNGQLATDGSDVWFIGSAIKTTTCAFDGNPWDEYFMEVFHWTGSSWFNIGTIEAKTANNGADFLASEYFGFSTQARACAKAGKLYVWWVEGGHNSTTLAADPAEEYIERCVLSIFDDTTMLVQNDVFYSSAQDDQALFPGGPPSDPYRTVYGHSVPAPNNSAIYRLTAIGDFPMLIRVPPLTTDHSGGYDTGTVYDHKVDCWQINDDATLTHISSIDMDSPAWPFYTMSDSIFQVMDMGISNKLWTDPIDSTDVIYVSIFQEYLSHGNVNAILRLSSDGTTWSWFDNDTTAFPSTSPARIFTSVPIWSIMPETHNCWMNSALETPWHYERQCPHVGWLLVEAWTPFGSAGYRGSTGSFEAVLDGDWIYYLQSHNFGSDVGFGKSHICRLCVDC